MSRSKRKAGRSGQAAPRAAAPPTTPPATQPVVVQQRQAVPQTGSVPDQDQQTGPLPLRKDQQRALRAYEWANAARDVLGEYQIAVQSFAAALLRSGFAAAVSVLERNKDRSGYQRLLDNLAAWPLPGIQPRSSSAEWPAQVRALADITQYMQATRELVLLLNWLRRACRALGAGGG
jgi:hypothetical protein